MHSMRYRVRDVSAPVPSSIQTPCLTEMDTSTFNSIYNFLATRGPVNMYGGEFHSHTKTLTRASRERIHSAGGLCNYLGFDPRFTISEGIVSIVEAEQRNILPVENSRTVAEEHVERAQSLSSQCRLHSNATDFIPNWESNSTVLAESNTSVQPPTSNITFNKEVNEQLQMSQEKKEYSTTIVSTKTIDLGHTISSTRTDSLCENTDVDQSVGEITNGQSDAIRRQKACNIEETEHHVCSTSEILAPALSASLPSTFSPALSASLPTTLAPALSASLPSTFSPALSASLPSTFSPALSASLPSTFAPALSASIPAIVATSVSASLPGIFTKALPASVSTTLARALSASLPTTVAPALSVLPKTLTPKLSASLPRTLAPALSASLPTTVAPALTASLRRTFAQVVSAPGPKTFAPALSASVSRTLAPKLPVSVPRTLTPALSASVSRTLASVPGTLATALPATVPGTLATPLPATVPGILATALPATVPGTLATSLPASVPRTLASVPGTLATSLPASVPGTLASVPGTLATSLPATVPGTLATVPGTLATSLPASVPRTLVSVLGTLATALPASVPRTLVSVPRTLATALPASVPRTLAPALPAPANICQSSDSPGDENHQMLSHEAPSRPDNIFERPRCWKTLDQFLSPQKCPCTSLLPWDEKLDSHRRFLNNFYTQEHLFFTDSLTFDQGCEESWTSAVSDTVRNSSDPKYGVKSSSIWTPLKEPCWNTSSTYSLQDRTNMHTSTPASVNRECSYLSMNDSLLDNSRSTFCRSPGHERKMLNQQRKKNAELTQELQFLCMELKRDLDFRNQHSATKVNISFNF